MADGKSDSEATTPDAGGDRESVEKSRMPLWKNPLVFRGAGAAILAFFAWVCVELLGLFEQEGDSILGYWLQLGLCILFVVGVAAVLTGWVRARRRSVAVVRAAEAEAEESSMSQGLREAMDIPSDRPRAYRPKHVPLWNNLISLVGLFLVTIGVVLLLTFGLFSLITPTHNPYVDIVGYLALPSILAVGLVLVPLGILFKSWRLRRHDPEQKLTFLFPRFDLNDPVQRRVVKFFLAATFLVLPVVGVSGYHGYHYTDSSQFCGYACHGVMKPQATAYEHSAHARVSCAECHIGSGASWFVKSKLSGTRQVFATWQNSYPRPIPSAISELRPARDTCERCHWPKKFFGAQLREIVLFASDEKNTRRQVDILLKTGGGKSMARSESVGIHRHVDPSLTIEYIATDDKLQKIPWVKLTDEGGNELIYRSDGRPSSDPPPEGLVRRMDCMDCHNRPAHKFRSPQENVDSLLEAGRIDTALPFIKREAVAVLVPDYPDTETAEARIGSSLIEFYRDNYPDLWENRRNLVYQAIDGVREIYRQSSFPDMKVNWLTYPDHIGHKTSAGCFRCHMGRHVNQQGETISHKCNNCHSFLNPVRSDSGASIVEKGEFIHPLELAGKHRTLRCNQCHTGGVAPESTCQGCHKQQQGFYSGTTTALAPYDVKPNPMFGTVDCEGCHDLSEPLSVDSVNALCMDCHEDEEEEYEGMLATWMDQIGEARGKAEKAVQEWERELADDDLPDSASGQRDQLMQCRSTLQLLNEAGPHHNIDAAMKIYTDIYNQATTPENSE